MKKKRQIEISVLIVNYNNKKFVLNAINSVKKQNYKNFEIIVVDDQSTDGSIKILKRLKNILLLQTKFKKKSPSYNQMNAYLTGFKKSKGKIICFLDSDDFFEKNKLRQIQKYFETNKETQIISDKPFIFYNQKKNYKMKFISRPKILIPWQKFAPQSCISVRKRYLKKIMKKIILLKFPNTWMDFRLVCQATIDFGKMKILDNYFTYYRQNPNSQILEYKKKYSLKWWKKREEAHLFQNFIYKKNKKSINYSFDRFFTKIINILLIK